MDQQKANPSVWLENKKKGTRDKPLIPRKNIKLLLDVPVEGISHHTADDTGGWDNETGRIGHDIRAGIHRDDDRVVI